MISQLENAMKNALKENNYVDAYCYASYLDDYKRTNTNKKYVDSLIKKEKGIVKVK